MPDELIGGVAVKITGDYSQLVKDYSQAQSISAKAGEAIAQSFSRAVQPANTLTQATERLKAAEAALNSEGAKMLAQVQASAPGYTAAQAALARLNAEVVEAKAAFSAATTAQQAATSATASFASTASAAAAAAQPLASSLQATTTAMQQQTVAATASIGAIMAGANAQMQSAQATNSAGAAASNAGIPLFRLMMIVGLLRKAFEELDSVRKSEMDLLHLAEATGIAIQRLAQFEGMVNLAGGDGEKLSTVITHLAQSMEQGNRGVERMADDLHRLGVNAKDPIAAFFQIADTVHNTKDRFEALAAAATVLGIGETELVGILSQGSAVLKQYYNDSQQLATARVQAIESASRLTAAENEVKAAMTAIAVGSLPLLTEGLKGVATGFSALNILVKIVAQAIMHGFTGAIEAAKDLGTVLSDIGHGKWEMIAVDAKVALSNVREQFKAMTKDMERETGESVAFIAKLWSGAQPQGSPGAGKAFPAETVKPKASHEASDQMQIWRDELQDRKFQNGVTLEEERKFWADNLAVAEQGVLKVGEAGLKWRNVVRQIQQDLLHIRKQQTEDLKRSNAEDLQDIHEHIKDLQEAALEAGGHPAAVKLQKLVDLTSSDTGLSGDVIKHLMAQIPDAQKAAGKEATEELRRTVEEQDQLWMESETRSAAAVKQRAVSTRAALEELRGFFPGIDALIDSQTNKIIAASRRIAEDRTRAGAVNRAGDLDAALAGNTQKKIELEASYAGEVIHTAESQISFARQLAAIEADNLQLKLRSSQIALEEAMDAEDLVGTAQAHRDIQRDQLAISLQTEQSALRRKQLEHDLSLRGRTTSGLSNDFNQAGQSLAQSFGNAVANGGKIGLVFRDALKGLEASAISTVLGEAFKKAVAASGLEKLFNKLGGGPQLSATHTNTTSLQILTEAVRQLTVSMQGTTAATAADTTATTADATATTANTGSVIANTVATGANTIALYVSAAIGAITSLLGGGFLKGLGGGGKASVSGIDSHAKGGRPAVGVPSIVGEEGPELFIPSGSGEIIPHGKSMDILMGLASSRMSIPDVNFSMPGAPTPVTASNSGGSGFMGGNSSSVVTNQNTGLVGGLHINISGAHNPREVARQIADIMKRQSPRFSPSNS